MEETQITDISAKLKTLRTLMYAILIALILCLVVGLLIRDSMETYFIILKNILAK